MRGVTHKHCSHPSTSYAREKCRENRPKVAPATTPRGHADCEHPNTQAARKECRKKRAEWAALMSDVVEGRL